MNKPERNGDRVSPSWGGPLTEEDYATLAASGITRELADQAMLRRLDTSEGCEVIGQKRSRDCAGMLIPYYWPGELSPFNYRIRRDNPDWEQGKAGSLKEKGKYLGPPNGANRLYIPPGVTLEQLRDTTISIVIVEGEKKALALWALAWHDTEKPRFIPLAIPSVWSWRCRIAKATGPRGKRIAVPGLIADLNRIEWKGRTVVIVFDADVHARESMDGARKGISRELASRGADARLVNLPEASGVNGVDELLVAWGRITMLPTEVSMNFQQHPMAQRIEPWLIEKLVPYARNPRTHSDAQVAKIAASIAAFGFNNPILVDTKAGIIAGHGRLLAARKLQLRQVPVIVLDHLTEVQKRGYIFADNQLALTAGWDEELLRMELAALQEEDFNLNLTGFEDEELARLRADQDAAEGLTDEDAVPGVLETPVTVAGDLWALGPHHRLLCGDATVAADVQRLMAGAAAADLVFTDPPYNVDYEGYTEDRLIMQGDRMSAEQFQQFLATSFANYRAIVKPRASLYICHPSSRQREFQNALEAADFEVRSQIIWAKNTFAWAGSTYLADLKGSPREARRSKGCILGICPEPA